MKPVNEKRDYKRPETARLESALITEITARGVADTALQAEIDAAEADILAVQAEVDAEETARIASDALLGALTPQIFRGSGAVDMTSFGKRLFVQIDNTGGAAIVDIDLGVDYELNVKVIAYDGGNVCQLRAMFGTIDGSGTVDYVALYDGARYLCDGTDWWGIP